MGAIFNNCCFSIDLKSGCVALGIYFTALATCSILYGYSYGIGNATFSSSAGTSGYVVDALVLAMGIVLIVGALQGQKTLMLIATILLLVAMIILLIHIILRILFFFQSNCSNNSTGYCGYAKGEFAWVTYLLVLFVLDIYFLLVIYSQYASL